MLTPNFLPERNQVVTLSTGDWTISGGTMTVANLVSPIANYHSLLITPTNSNSTVQLELENIVIPSEYRLTPVQFYAQVKTEHGTRAAVLMDCSEQEFQGYVSTRNSRTGSNTWTTVRSNRMVVPDITAVITARVRITFTEHGGQDLYVSVPYMYATFLALTDPFVASVYAQMPNIFLQYDNQDFAEGNMPEFPIVRLIEAGLEGGRNTYAKYFDFQYVDEEDAQKLNYTATPSTLVDPAAIEEPNAKWLAQILGFKIDDPQQQTTPWGGLPTSWREVTTAIDNTGLSASPTSLVRASNVVTATFSAAHNLSVNDVVSVTATDGTATTFSGTFTITAVTTTPTHTATWAQTDSGETATETHLVALLDTNWTELEEFNPDYYDRATYTGWQIETAFSGVHAGTLNALKEAAKFNLSGDKVVTITNRYSNDAWRILVTTKTSETPGGVLNTENETILQAINRVKPVGFKLNHTCTTSGS